MKRILFTALILGTIIFSKAQSNLYGEYIGKDKLSDTSGYDIVLQLNCDKTFALQSKLYEAKGKWTLAPNHNIIFFSHYLKIDKHVSNRKRKMKLEIEEHELAWRGGQSEAKMRRQTRKEDRRLSKSAGEKVTTNKIIKQDLHFAKRHDLVCD